MNGFVKCAAIAGFGLTACLFVPSKVRAEGNLLQPARTLSANVHAVVSGGYWSHGGREGFFRTVVMAGGVEHVSHELYLQWLQIDPGTQSYKVIKTAGIPQINDASGGYVLDVKAAYPESNSLKLTVTARSERYPQAVFIITGKGDGSFAVSRAGQ